MAEKKYESTSYIKHNIYFDVENNNFVKTLGFVINFPSNDELELYKLTKDNNYTSQLVQKINFSDSTHMLINLVQPKHGIVMEPTNLNIYCGKLKKL
ncbi:MAG: hypothetical protein Q8784_02360 [Vigna little leaf phytoplasma]|nr:hypothetical protein [Vigna little leaf phytoplasma]